MADISTIKDLGYEIESEHEKLKADRVFKKDIDTVDFSTINKVVLRVTSGGVEVIIGNSVNTFSNPELLPNFMDRLSAEANQLNSVKSDLIDTLVAQLADESTEYKTENPPKPVE